MEKRAISGGGKAAGRVRSRTIMERASGERERERVSERASEAAEVVSLDSPPWPASAFLLGLDRTKWREREKGSY